jgi:hypothetical protein
MNLRRSNTSHKQYCCVKGFEGSGSSENLKFFRYRLRDPVMIYVVAMRTRHFCFRGTKCHMVGLMHRHMYIVYSELDESVPLFDIVL